MQDGYLRLSFSIPEDQIIDGMVVARRALAALWDPVGVVSAAAAKTVRPLGRMPILPISTPRARRRPAKKSLPRVREPIGSNPT